MKHLTTLIKEFNGSGLNEEQLTKKFEEIAKAAMYGGHFRVNGEFDIHINEVEFYFHSEDEEITSVHDWTMYHRGKDLPYFPIGSLHPHRSGVDVTFENEKEAYRASFLIRKYEIDGVVYDKPSFLCEDLIGYTGCILGDGPKIEWINEETLDMENYSLEENTRINLSAYDEKGNLKKGERDARPWRFTKK